ncbi:ATP-binding protein [Flavivirga abyssicola]|uniref:hybrid sensor histidine kinase/response regulator transcription factor n=1 Tax=Flavivirga abyssicola TaxID=3063533 RepID=UPI0026DF6A98|nr:hybrid sensor histidine kinase/response regulator transcription factor [Flavivirga sp. MEBiC07777]WVK13779.1 ATP-binding protein [Flavivirga sp. MEBiC07777]
MSFFYCISAIAQDEIIKYSQKYTISEGLAHNGVTTMYEDSRGFLWFGTYDGLNKFDGYNFQTFKNTIDKEILTSNRVRSLYEDNNHNLWIGTDEGVTGYNFINEKFTKIYSNKQNGNAVKGPVIRKIFGNKFLDHIFCLTEGDGVLVFDKDSNFLKRYLPPVEKFGDDMIFFDVMPFGKNALVFATSKGLILFDFSEKKFKQILKDKVLYANAIVKASNHSFLATISRGIVLVKHNNTLNPNNFEIDQEALQDFRFNSIMLNDSGKLWLGELNEGIIQIDNIDIIRKGLPIEARGFKDNLKILRSSRFMLTSQNICWYATFNEGVYKFDMVERPFGSYNVSMDYDFGLGSNSVTHIAPFGKDHAFISASYGGLSLFNSVLKKFERLPFNFPIEKEQNVGGVFVDSRKNTWIYISGESNLYRLRKGYRGYEKIELNNLSETTGPRIRSCSEDKYGNVWVVGSDQVYKVLIDAGNTVTNVEYLSDNPFFKNNKIELPRRVYSDSIYGFMWIGADTDGLFRIANKKDTPIEELIIHNFVNDKKDEHSLPSNFVSSIIRLPNDDLWIGTEGSGICKVLNSDSIPRFIPFTEKDGLSNNVVKNILYDENFNLWIPTNIGLNKFDTKTNEFRKFNKSDGLPFEDFWFASETLDNGTMILSGLDGFCYFNPKDVNTKEQLPKLQFENFKIFDKEIMPGDTLNGRVVLQKSIGVLDKIELKHNENVFSLDLTSLHFSNDKNHLIKYKLSQINNDWIVLPSSQKTIYYSGLQPGDYELTVMASNSLNEWTSSKKLKIEIMPSIWNTHLAYFLYTLLGFLLIYLVIRVILKIQTLNHKVEIEQMEINNVKEINEAKLTFFSNISHEIKTPLALISGPMNILLERFKGNPDVGEKLGLMQRQSKKIHQLIEQVHDFRKTDANALKMNYTRFSFNSFMDELIGDFNMLAKNDNKKLEVEGENKVIMVSADRDKLEKIFNNLLSNAFKYTKTDDTIKVVYKTNDKDLVVSVIDTGKGIDAIDLEHIFERFYRSHKKENIQGSGSGIGLAFSKRLVEMHYGFIDAESQLKEGTTINVRLPIVKELLEEEKHKSINLPDEKEVKIDNHLFKKDTISNVEVSGEFSDTLIFYAEDNPEMRTFVSEILSGFFKVKSFRNGHECFEAFEKEWPDVVISDVQMPEMNGLDLCLKIKSDLKTSHIPVILLTALANIEDHLKGIRDGADAYIKKPFNIQRLVTNVEALLRNRKQLRERYQVGIPLTRENNKNNRNDNAFLEKLYSLMEEHLDNQDLDLNHLAKELYLNRTHFYQKVKVLTNQTPFELLKNYRLKKAANFLAQKRLSVNEAFEMTGFKSRTHFTKVFKEKFGVTPGKYIAKTSKSECDNN